MAAQLNIKDGVAIRLAQDLAQKYGKSVTATVREALEEMARRDVAEREGKLARLNHIVDEIQQGLPDEIRGMTSKQLMDELYDEYGLPK